MGDKSIAEQAKVTTTGSDPAIELPDGSRINLDTHINRLSGDVTETNESVSYETEVCSDDFSWWHLATESDLEVVIMPQLSVPSTAD